MGACSTQSTYSRPNSYIKKKLVSIINKDSRFKLTNFMKSCALSHGKAKNIPIDYNQIICRCDNIDMNALAYSLYKGSQTCFVTLFKSGLVDPFLLHKNFPCSIDMICKQGYLEILKIYLPIHLILSEKFNLRG